MTWFEFFNLSEEATYEEMKSIYVRMLQENKSADSETIADIQYYYKEASNYHVLSQALLYSEQITGDDKEILGEAIKRFEFALDKKSRIDILKTREQIAFLIKEYDKPVKITFRKRATVEFDDILN